MSRKRKWTLGAVLAVFCGAGLLWFLVAGSTDDSRGRPSATAVTLASVLDRIGIRTEFAKRVRFREMQWQIDQSFLKAEEAQQRQLLRQLFEEDGERVNERVFDCVAKALRFSRP